MSGGGSGGARNFMPPALLRRRLKRAAAWAESEAARLRDLDDAAFAASLTAARAALRLGRDDDGASGERALAHAAAVAARTLALTPRAEQLQAALAMHQGKVAWLPADAGKSLAIALAAILHAWRGHPCRVATLGAYLARRDSDRLRPLYAGCGLSLACVTEETAADPDARPYAADVVYAAARQVLADSLREQVLRGAVDDPLRTRLRGMAAGGGAEPPRGRAALLVDDADLVLIDEAGSPLVISAPGDNPMLLDAVRAAREAVVELQAGRDYRLLTSRRDIVFSAAGETCLEALGERLPGIWRDAERRDDLMRQAIGVRDLLENGRHYRVAEGKLVILDDGIGRLLASRGWTQGLVQAIEAREGLDFTPPARTLARMSYPGFIRRQAFVGGVGRGYPGAGTMLREGYDLTSLRLAAAEPAPLLPMRCFSEREAKLDALAENAVRLRDDGRPVLIVTRRAGDGEAVARRLEADSIVCAALDARALDDAALAGLAEPGRITLAQSAVLQGAGLPASARGKLTVLLAEAHDLAHADLRVAGLAAAGASLFVALDDELPRQYFPQASAWLRARAHAPWATRALIHLAQWLAVRAQRKQGKLLVRRDAMLNQQLAFTGEQDIDLDIYAFGNPGKD
jgi:preprotein translocase subunit SecA